MTTSNKAKSTKSVKPTIGSKPTAKQLKAAKTPAIEMVNYYSLVGGKKSPYSALRAERKDFAAWIIAAGLVCNYIKLSDKNQLVGEASKSQYSAFKDYIGASAWSHWNGTTDRLEHVAAGTNELTGKKEKAVEKFTGKGLTEINARIQGKSKGYDTELAIVKRFAAAMVKGGKVKGNSVTYDLSVCNPMMRIK
jgi:hypothetical protein